MPTAMHKHVCLQAYVDAPSRGATLGVHLRFQIAKALYSYLSFGAHRIKQIPLPF
jgi:hypothetical protein